MKQMKRKHALITQLERKKGVEIEELLRRLYVDEHKTIQTIANELSISYVTAHQWLQRAGIYHHAIDFGE